jgi:hypothetical protein
VNSKRASVNVKFNITEGSSLQAVANAGKPQMAPRPLKDRVAAMIRKSEPIPDAVAKDNNRGNLM